MYFTLTLCAYTKDTFLASQQKQFKKSIYDYLKDAGAPLLSVDDIYIIQISPIGSCIAVTSALLGASAPADKLTTTFQYDPNTVFDRKIYDIVTACCVLLNTTGTPAHLVQSLKW